MCCSALQCVAVCCSVVQCVEVCYRTRSEYLIHHYSSTHYNTLQHTATHCNTLQHTTLFGVIYNISNNRLARNVRKTFDFLLFESRTIDCREICQKFDFSLREIRQTFEFLCQKFERLSRNSTDFRISLRKIQQTFKKFDRLSRNSTDFRVICEKCAPCCSPLRTRLVWCSVLQRGAVCCSVLQCVAGLDGNISYTTRADF